MNRRGFIVGLVALLSVLPRKAQAWFGRGQALLPLTGITTEQIGGTDWNEMLAVAIQADGKIIVSGTTNYNTGAQWDADQSQWQDQAHFCPTLRRFNTDGSIDTTFGAGGDNFIEFPGLTNFDAEATNIYINADGSFFVPFVYFQGSPSVFTAAKNGVAKFTSAGLLDPTWGNYGVVWVARAGSSYVDITQVKTQSDGTIIAAGSQAAPGFQMLVSALFPNGTLKTGFGNQGLYFYKYNTADVHEQALLIQSDDKIVVAGCLGDSASHQQFAVIRLSSNGVDDATWGSSGTVNVDFPSQLQARPHAGLLQEPVSGKIIIGGWAAYDVGGDTAIALARLNTDGSLDTSFGVSSGLTYTHGGQYASDQTISAGLFYDGTKIVVAGYSSTTSVAGNGYHTPTSSVLIARYTGSGIPDTTFNSTGFKDYNIAGTNNEISYGAAIQADGKYVVSGHTHGADGHGHGHVNGSKTFLMRVNQDGSLDTTFGLQRAYWGPPPAVTTNAASSITATTAIANASINPQGKSTSWAFQYGLATGFYHYQTAAAVVGSGGAPVAVTANLTGLVPGYTYYGRAVAWSAQGGVQFGQEVSFTASTGSSPTTIFSDTFTDVDNTKLVGYHFPDVNLVGNQWVAAPGTPLASAIILSNKCQPLGNPDQVVLDIRLTDHYTVLADFVCTNSLSSLLMGLMLRYGSDSNYWNIGLDGSNFFIKERIAGNSTTRATAAQTVVIGTKYTISVSVSGSTVTATVNGGNSISYGSFNSLSSNTQVGFQANSNSGAGINTVDNFLVTKDQ